MTFYFIQNSMDHKDYCFSHTIRLMPYTIMKSNNKLPAITGKKVSTKLSNMMIVCLTVLCIECEKKSEIN